MIDPAGPGPGLLPGIGQSHLHGACSAMMFVCGMLIIHRHVRPSALWRLDPDELTLVAFPVGALVVCRCLQQQGLLSFHMGTLEGTPSTRRASPGRWKRAAVSVGGLNPCLPWQLITERTLSCWLYCVCFLHLTRYPSSRVHVRTKPH